MPRRPSLSLEERGKIVSLLFDSLEEDLGDRLDWVEKRVRSFEDWMNPSPGVKKTPWEGASNVTPPLIAKVVRALHARLLGSIFNADPLVHVIPVDTRNMEAARVREKFLNEQIRNEIPNFYRELNTVLLDMVVQGTGFLMLWYERTRDSVADWLLADRFSTLVGAEVERTDQEVIEEFLTEITATRALGGHSYSVDHRYQGFERTSRVTLDRSDPEIPQDRISITIEHEQVEEGLRVKAVPIEDLAFPANATSLQIEDCHHVFRFFWLYPNQIRRKRDLGLYHALEEKDLEQLEKLVGGGSHAGGIPQEITNVEEALDQYQGIRLVNGQSGIEQGKVLCVEAYYPYDVNGDGLEEQMIFTWIPELRKLASWDYLSVRFGHGRRPFIPFTFMPVTGRLYALGLAEMLADLQAEAATIFNQVNDRENLTNNPIMLMEMNAGIAPNVLKNAPPGTILPVRNVERVRALEWGKDPHAGLPVLQQLYAFAEQVAGIGDIQVGVQPNRPNAPRTARGTLALISESNIIIDTHVLNTQFVSLHELLHQIDGLNRQYLPPERVFFVVGEMDPLMITREDLRERVKFYFSGNTANTNLQVKQTIAQLLFQSLIGTPIFTGQFVQMPPTSITATHRLTEHYIREHIPGKDARLFLPPLEEVMQVAESAQQAQLQGMEEGRMRAEQANQQVAQEESLMALLGGGNRGGAARAPTP